MAKKIREIITEVADRNTGEILETDTRTYVRTTKSEDFIQVYLEDLSGLFALNGKIEHNLIVLLWKDTNFNTNKIFLLRTQKEKYALDLNCNIDSINNAIISLTKKQLLLREDRGVYHLNPKFFFKGDTPNRKVVIKYLGLGEFPLEPNRDFENK